MQSDAARLALLDGASTISRTLRSFVDDTRAAIASWGEAAVAVDVLERVASEDQYVYKQGKNKVVVNNFARRRPLQLQGSEVEFADQHVQLGIVLDTRYDGRAHLHHILSRGSSKMHLLLLELSTLGLPMHALLLSVRTRMLPSVAFGVELVVHTPCSDKQLNSMQASWMMKISGCALVPRVVYQRSPGRVPSCFGGVPQQTLGTAMRTQSSRMLKWSRPPGQQLCRRRNHALRFLRSLVWCRH